MEEWRSRGVRFLVIAALGLAVLSGPSETVSSSDLTSQSGQESVDAALEVAQLASDCYSTCTYYYS